MAYSATVSSAMPGTLRPAAHHPLQQAAVYAIAGLVGLAVMPVLFVTLDHAVVVRWSNEILDRLSAL